ncbi:hypothetical protein ACIBFB_25405 [Nocardiopsis sp. NPDC050513]|uniref:hypothetical protein n=1 Tax=Nocardiopsis sp. NPDC050513 TaxID=3364338 RepID=UPI0037A57CFF
MRLASATVLVAVAGLLAVAAFDGFERADTRTGSLDPGTELNTFRYRVTPLAAQVAQGDSGTEIRVRVDVENTDSEPMPVSHIGHTTRFVLEPGGTALPPPAPVLSLVRYPEGRVTSLQPHMPEEAVLSVPVEDTGGLAAATDLVMTVHRSERISASGDGAPLWVRGALVAGSVTLSLEGS